MVLVADQAEDVLDAATELARIGFERVLGWLSGGIDAWGASGRTTAAYPTLGVRALARERATGVQAPVLDVRQPMEWAEGALPGSRRVFLADVPARIAELARMTDGTAWTVMCRSGQRAAIGASILAAAGIPVRLVTPGGVPDLPMEMLERA
jgi:rhodanese-related sulfurtransferase